MKVGSSQSHGEKEVSVFPPALCTVSALRLGFLSLQHLFREGRAPQSQNHSPENMRPSPLNFSSIFQIKCFLEDTPSFVGSSGANAPGLKSRDEPAGLSWFAVALTLMS